MSEENRLIVRKFYEAYSTGNVDALDDIVADSFMNHNPGEASGLEGMKRRIINSRRAFESRFAIEDMLDQGDKVAVRYTMTGIHKEDFQGIEPTGREFLVGGIGIYRVSDGKIVERWVQVDINGILQQFAVVPE